MQRESLFCIFMSIYFVFSLKFTTFAQIISVAGSMHGDEAEKESYTLYITYRNGS